MAAAGAVTPWWVVVLIASVPPIALAATAHLGALLSTRSTSIEATGNTVPADATAAAAQVESTPADSAVDQQESRVEPPPIEARRTRSIGDLRNELVRAIESDSIELDPASAESIRKALRCSPKRARQLRDEYATRPRLAVVGEQA